MTLNPQFVTDKKGKRKAVQLSLKEYAYIIEELELKEDIAVYEKIKANNKNTGEADWEVVKRKLDKKHRIKG
jgi:hypothetical protein